MVDHDIIISDHMFILIVQNIY